MLLQIENLYWAAMTALIVIQPARGMLLEKSVYRLLGSAIGAVAGFGLLLYTSSPLLLTQATRQPDRIKAAPEESSHRLYTILKQALKVSRMVPEAPATLGQIIDQAEETRYAGHAGELNALLAIQRV